MNKAEIIRKLKQTNGLSPQEQSYLIELVNNGKKYGLVWENKPEFVEEQMQVNFPVLNEVKEKAIINGDACPNHILIQGDNLHALTALTFTHERSVDLIYIDPPYNTGNKDFIYNDEYVDKDDEFRHSKWLSFMHKRLKVAGTLLSSKGIIVISIGYQEVHNLVLLCEEMFPQKQVVCVTVQTSGGKPSGGFNYLQEYIVFITPLDFDPNPLSFSGGINRSPFEGLTLSTFDKTQRPNQTYPIFIDKETGGIVGTGQSLTNRVKNGTYKGDLGSFTFDYNEAPEGTVAIWPVTSKGKECVWRLIPSRLMQDWSNGYIKVSPNVSSKNPNQYSVQYLPDGVIKKIKAGELEVVGTEQHHPTLVFGENKTAGSDIPTIWTEKSFFTTKGSGMLKDIVKESKFSYPKPVELVSEILRATTNTDSLILDFFAGSGTTLHAIMQLNTEDDGSRQCILVTNNENNIAEKVCYERNKRVIHGYINTQGQEVEGLINNNLRYYQNVFVAAAQTEQNKRLLTQHSTELLCIKEDCYTELTKAGGFNARQCRIFTNGNGKYLVVVYHSRQQYVICEQLVTYIKNLQNRKEPVVLYAFSPERETLMEDFADVADSIRAVPLPQAIYNAYRATFRTLKLARGVPMAAQVLEGEDGVAATSIVKNVD